jgi:hypothetical protein
LTGQNKCTKCSVKVTLDGIMNQVGAGSIYLDIVKFFQLAASLSFYKIPVKKLTLIYIHILAPLGIKYGREGLDLTAIDRNVSKFFCLICNSRKRNDNLKP